MYKINKYYILILIGKQMLIKKKLG